jgi:hypothetical protein
MGTVPILALRNPDTRFPLGRSGLSSAPVDVSTTAIIPEENVLISEDTMTLSADTVAGEIRRRARRESG